MTDYTELLNSIMSSAEVAERLGITDAAVRMAIRRGTLPARKLGTGHHDVWIIPRAEVDAWQQRRSRRNLRTSE